MSILVFHQASAVEFLKLKYCGGGSCHVGGRD